MLQSTMVIVVNILNNLIKLSPGVLSLTSLSLSAKIYIRNIVCCTAKFYRMSKAMSLARLGFS